MDAIQYCRDKVLLPGSSFYYSLFKLSQAEQDGLVALYALCKEIQDIPNRINEESVARAKLQWWSEEIQRLYVEQPKHPATQALLPTVQTQQLPQALFEELITSTELKFDVDHCCTAQDYLLYCYRETGIRTILASYITGFTEKQTLKFAHDMGVTITHIQDIINFRRAIQTGRVYFPLEDLEQFNIDSKLLQQGQQSPEIVNLLSHYSEKALAFYEKAKAQLPKTDKKTQRHQLIYGKLYIKLLQEIKADGFQVLKHQIKLTPLRKYWIAWRG